MHSELEAILFLGLALLACCIAASEDLLRTQIDVRHTNVVPWRNSMRLVRSSEYLG